MVGLHGATNGRFHITRRPHGVGSRSMFGITHIGLLLNEAFLIGGPSPFRFGVRAPESSKKVMGHTTGS